MREREEVAGAVNSETYQFIYSIVQEMTYFRFQAEEYFKGHEYIAKSKRRELPIPADSIKTKYFDEPNEPPETVVSRIAQNQIYVIDAVLLKVRKTLRRERELTRISNVQQLDSQCLVWLTRQPGITPAQKAGMKQKLMSVVRKENYDILENRVLKSVLKLCSSFCQRYLRKNGREFKDSQRIKAVHHLYCRAQMGLKQEVMGTINAVRGIPRPNYVLLHDPLYSQIWQMYLDLLDQTALMKQSWRYRHKLLLQYFLFCFANVLWIKYENMLVFNSQFWISVDRRNNGIFLKDSSFRRIFTVNNIIGQFTPKAESSHQILGSAEIRYGSTRHFVSLVYLPADSVLRDLRVSNSENHTYFLYSDMDIKLSIKSKQVILIKKDCDLFFQLNDWFVKFIGGLK